MMWDSRALLAHKWQQAKISNEKYIVEQKMHQMIVKTNILTIQFKQVLVSLYNFCERKKKCQTN